MSKRPEVIANKDATAPVHTKIGVQKKLDQKEANKEASQLKHSQDASMNSHSQTAIKHAASNRGK